MISFLESAWRTFRIYYIRVAKRYFKPVFRVCLVLKKIRSFALHFHVITLMTVGVFHQLTSCSTALILDAATLPPRGMDLTCIFQWSTHSRIVLKIFQSTAANLECYSRFRANCREKKSILELTKLPERHLGTQLLQFFQEIFYLEACILCFCNPCKKQI